MNKQKKSIVYLLFFALGLCVDSAYANIFDDIGDAFKSAAHAVGAAAVDAINDTAGFFGYHPEDGNYSIVPNSFNSSLVCSNPNPVEQAEAKIKRAQMVAQIKALPGYSENPISTDLMQAYQDFREYHDAVANLADFVDDTQSRTVEITGQICPIPYGKSVEVVDLSKAVARSSACFITTSLGARVQWQLDPSPGACWEHTPLTAQQVPYVICQAVTQEDKQLVSNQIEKSFRALTLTHNKIIAQLTQDNDTTGITSENSAYQKAVDTIALFRATGKLRIDAPYLDTRLQEVYPPVYDFAANKRFATYQSLYPLYDESFDQITQVIGLTPLSYYWGEWRSYEFATKKLTYQGITMTIT